MKRLITWLILILLLGGFGTVVFLTLRTQAAVGKGMPPFSVYSAEDDGLDELAQLLRKLRPGWEPVAMTRPVQHTHYRGLLIVAEPERDTEIAGLGSQVSEADARALVQWVERGNTLLLCGRHPGTIHRELGVEVIQDDQSADELPHEATLGEAGGYSDGIDKLVIEKNDGLRADNSIPLWWGDREAGALLLPRGKGRVIVVADPSLLTLRGLWRGDNARFLYNVAWLDARDRRIYFDEYHHGFRSGGGFWGYLHYYDQQWILLQVLVVTGVAVWAVAIRLGPAVPQVSEPHADAVDYASAVARIYQRAGARKLLATALVREFMGKLSRHLRLPRTALPAEILAAWRRQHPEAARGGGSSPSIPRTLGPSPGEQLRELLGGVTQLRKGETSERQLLAWAGAFDRFETEVLRGR